MSRRTRVRVSFVVTASAAVVAGFTAQLTGCAFARGVAYEGADLMMRTLDPDPVPIVVATGGGGDIVGVCAGNSIAYIVPVDAHDAAAGVVLVDAGFDEHARALQAAVGSRRVRAVLLTHGHLDHRAGAHVFNAPVYVGRGDVDLVRGVGHSHSLGAVAGDILALPSPPPAPRALRPVDDGDVVTINDSAGPALRFRAIALPGHTAGSIAWFLEGAGVLFTGDALQQVTPGALYVAPPIFSDDARAEHHSLEALRDVPLRSVLDGHYGALTQGARARVRSVVERVHHGDEAMFATPLPRAVRCDAPPPM